MCKCSKLDSMSTLFPHTLNVSFNILDNLPQHLPYLDNSIMNTFLFCGRCMLYFVTAVYMWVAFSPKKKTKYAGPVEIITTKPFLFIICRNT